MTTFLETFSKLKAARTLADRRRLSKEASNLLVKEPRALEATLRPLLLMTLRTLPNETVVEVMKSDFFSLRVSTYVDDDGMTKVAVGVSFLQDYRFAVEGAEELIASEVQEMLELMNLDILVNDITVNALQYRGGVPATS